MNTPWFYSPTIEVGRVRLPDSESAHAIGSLRLRPGDGIVLFDGRGTTAPAVIEVAIASAGKRPTRGGESRSVWAIVTRLSSVPCPTPRLRIVVGGCKGDRLEWLVEKCTELGADDITIAQFSRSIVRPGENHVKKLERIALEACKQCGRAWLPTVRAEITFADALRESRGDELIVGDESDDVASFQHAAAGTNVTVFIGPEGGITPEETAALVAAGATRVRFSRSVLRTETATIAAVAILRAALARDA